MHKSQDTHEGICKVLASPSCSSVYTEGRPSAPLSSPTSVHILHKNNYVLRILMEDIVINNFVAQLKHFFLPIYFTREREIDKCSGSDMEELADEQRNKFLQKHI